MDIVEFGKQYGPWIAIALYALKWFFDKGWPVMVKWFDKSQDNETKKEEAQRLSEASERDWQHRMEERHMAAMEQIARALPEVITILSGVQADLRKVRDDTTVLIERKATVVTTSIPQ